ncbi:hypothetical protein DCC62_05970 [candidate division KSB1 bacterium]|nr:MAG: hypothetical protein DCC62_05970 [candidate division KSB1 bacterium]
MGKLIYEDLTYMIHGSLFRVYNKLGLAFREEAYKQAVKRDLVKSGHGVEAEKEIPIPYKNNPAIDTYRLDVLVDEKVLLELKHVAEIHKRFVAQTLSALHAGNYRVGMLVNFGAASLQVQRLVNPFLNPGKGKVQQFDKTRPQTFNRVDLSKVIHSDPCYSLYGCLYEVYNNLGPGFREITYRRAIFKELIDAGLGYEAEKETPVVFDDELIDTHKIEMIVDGKIILHMKAYSDLDARWKACLKSELRASGSSLESLPISARSRLSLSEF